MRQATTELNEEYYARIGQIEQANPHDILEIEASDGVSAIRWEDVLSVYAVKVTTDGVNGMDVVTMDEQKKEILRGVMWDMNPVSYTHLDVYKRQQRMRVLRRSPAAMQGLMFRNPNPTVCQ